MPRHSNAKRVLEQIIFPDMPFTQKVPFPMASDFRRIRKGVGADKNTGMDDFIHPRVLVSPEKFRPYN
jgi:hypothetical protein